MSDRDDSISISIKVVIVSLLSVGLINLLIFTSGTYTIRSISSDTDTITINISGVITRDCMNLYHSGTHIGEVINGEELSIPKYINKDLSNLTLRICKDNKLIAIGLFNSDSNIVTITRYVQK